MDERLLARKEKQEHYTCFAIKMLMEHWHTTRSEAAAAAAAGKYWHRIGTAPIGKVQI